MKNVIRNFLPSFIYALGVSLGINAALNELQRNKNSSFFFILSFSILLILVLEIIINYLLKNKKVELNLDIHDSINELSELFNKIVLPILLFISIVGFGYFNVSSLVLNVSTVLIFIAFFALFLNIRSFFQMNLTLESRTHFVYDFFKILIFFFIINTLSFLYVERPEQGIIFFILASGITFTLISLLIMRLKEINGEKLLYITVVSLFIGTVFSLLNRFLDVNPFQVSVILVFLFYIIIAIIQHRLTNTLTKDVLLEYILVVLIAVAILIGLS